MKTIFVSLWLAVAANAAELKQTTFPIGDFRNCPDMDRIRRFEALPGGGWDNLRNKDMGLVTQTNYTLCRITEDGYYLIPDETFVIPLKRSKLETYAELIEHWDNYTSITSSSVNAEGSYAKVVSGSFSEEQQTIKKQQVNDKSVTTRVMLRHDMYSIRLLPDAQLHPTFKRRLMDIAGHFANNNTMMADYLLELIVRDYGTHVVTSIEAGATLAQIDQIKSTFTSDYSNEKSSIKASASGSFFGVVGLGTGFSHSTSETISKQYLNNRTSSEVLTFGGPPFRVNFTINDWENGIKNALVANDRAGDPLHYVITPESLPEVPQPLVIQMAAALENKISLYYRFNTIRGCTSMDSQNFNFQANLDDGSCKAASTNFTFGGVYQTCQMHAGSNAGDVCSEVLQKNPLSGDYKCSPGYKPVLLNAGTLSKNTKQWQCHRHCHGLFHRCHNRCGNVYYSSSATYKAYWCVATGSVHQDSGYLFGGYFTTTSSNPVTKTRSCPIHFYPVRLGQNTKICVSDDYELGFRYSLPFAGFFSCKAGNPLVHQSNVKVPASDPKSWPHQCPTGYSQHLAALDQSCEINYCVKANSLTARDLPMVRRPPFNPRPGMAPNQTDLLYIIGPAKKVWIKNDTTQLWRRSTFFELDKITKEQQKSVDTDSSENGGEIALITVAATAVAGLVVIGMVLGIKRFRKRKTFDREVADESEPVVHNENAPYGSFENDARVNLDGSIQEQRV